MILHNARVAALAVACLALATAPVGAQLSTKPGGTIHGTAMLATPEPMPARASRPHAKLPARPNAARPVGPFKVRRPPPVGGPRVGPKAATATKPAGH